MLISISTIYFGFLPHFFVILDSMPRGGQRQRRHEPTSDDDSESLTNIEFVGDSDTSSSSGHQPANQRGWVASVVVGSLGLVSSAGFKALQYTTGRLTGGQEDEGEDRSTSESGSSDTASTLGECERMSQCSDTSSSSWGTARMYSSPGTMEVPPLSFPLRPPQMGQAQQDVISLMRHRARDTAPYGDEPSQIPDQEPRRHRTTLMEAIVLYREDPSDYTGSLIQSSLAARGLDERVSADELEAAGGDEALVTYIVKSGLLDVADFDVIKEIQACADETIVPMSAVDGRVDPVEVEFLRTLFEIPHIHISSEQRRLLRRSGFEFVKLLHDFPATQQGANTFCDVRSKCWWMRVTRHFQTLVLFINVVGMSAHSVGVAVLVTYWFQESLTKEYTVILLVFAACHVMSCFIVFLFQQMKAPPTVYGADSGDFPSIYPKVIPVIPLLEFHCFTSSFRHQIRGMKNIVLYHDVFAMGVLSFIVHSVTHSLVILMFVSYFLFWQTPEVKAATDASMLASLGWSIVLINSASTMFVAPMSYIWIIFAHDSVNSLGFALFGNSLSSGGTTDNGSIFARLIAIVLVYLFLINGVLLGITLANIGICAAEMIVWTSLSGAAVIISVVIIILIYYIYRNFLMAVRLTVIPLAIQLIFIFYIGVSDNSSDPNDDCRLFFIVGGVNAIVGYVGWGTLISLCVMWGLQKVYYTVKAKLNAPPPYEYHPPVGREPAREPAAAQLPFA